MRRDSSFLKDILTACRKIESIVESVEEESFLQNEVLTAAVLHHLTVIGEAISRLSADLRDHPKSINNSCSSDWLMHLDG